MFCLLLVGSIISVVSYCYNLHCTVKKGDNLFFNLALMDFIVVCMFAVSFLSYNDIPFNIISAVIAYGMLIWQLFFAKNHLLKTTT